MVRFKRLPASRANLLERGPAMIVCPQQRGIKLSEAVQILQQQPVLTTKLFFGAVRGGRQDGDAEAHRFECIQRERLVCGCANVEVSGRHVIHDCGVEQENAAFSRGPANRLEQLSPYLCVI